MVAEFRQFFEAGNSDRCGWAGFTFWLAVEVDHRADFAVSVASDDEFAGTESALLYEEVDDGAFADCHVRFDYETLDWDVDVGAEIFDVGREEDHVEEFFEVRAVFSGDWDHDRVTAPFFWVEVVVGGELRHCAVRVGVWFVDFVDRDDDFCV